MLTSKAFEVLLWVMHNNMRYGNNKGRKQWEEIKGDVKGMEHERGNSTRGEQEGYEREEEEG